MSSSSPSDSPPPPPLRLLWVVRHGERADNVDQCWRAKGAQPRGQWDDPPLSARGLVQAAEVGQRLYAESAQIAFLLCSPFSRCLQTAQQILVKMAENGCRPLPAVLIEPGFCESLNACQSPPGFLQMDEILQSYPNLPVYRNYQSHFRADQLPIDECTNFCCFRRVIGTLKNALAQLEGNLLVVSHGSPISAIHFALSGQLAYMGQCTVSHYRLAGQHGGSNENAVAQPMVAMANALLPRLCKSIVIRALPPERRELAELDENGEEAKKGEEAKRRRNTMPTGKKGAKGGGGWGGRKEQRRQLLALSLARLVDAAETRAELGEMVAECLAAGDAGHLSEKRDLHDVLHI